MSSNRCTRYASVASCRARMAELCHRRPASLYSTMSVVMSIAISRANGSKKRVRSGAGKIGARAGRERKEAYNAGEGQLADEQVCTLLVFPDLAQRDRPWSDTAFCGQKSGKVRIRYASTPPVEAEKQNTYSVRPRPRSGVLLDLLRLHPHLRRRLRRHHPEHGACRFHSRLL